MKFLGILLVALLVLIGGAASRLGFISGPAMVVAIEEADKDPRTVIGTHAPDLLHIVVEIQQGTQSRYVFANGVLSLTDAPYHPLNMPGDYGVLPQTLGRGGDPVGVIVLTTDPTPPGTLIVAKPIALLIADEGKIKRNVLLAVPTVDIRYRDVEEIADLQQDDKDAVIEFIKNYRTIQGRPVVSVEAKSSSVAKQIITLSMRAYARMNASINTSPPAIE